MRAPNGDIAKPNSDPNENLVFLRGFDVCWNDTMTVTAASVVGFCLRFQDTLVVILPMGETEMLNATPGIKSRHHPDLLCLFSCTVFSNQDISGLPDIVTNGLVWQDGTKFNFASELIGIQ